MPFRAWLAALFLGFSASHAGASDKDDIRAQIERHWNITFDGECKPEQARPIELRLHIDLDGTVTKIEPVGEIGDDACARHWYESAKRAAMIASPLKWPADLYYPILTLRFDLSQIVQ